MHLNVLAAASLLAFTLTPAHRFLPITSTSHNPRPTARLVPDGSDALNRLQITDEEREYIDRINAERTERGLCALTPDPLLIQVARGHSWDMSERGYFSHVATLNGQHTPMDRYLRGLHNAGQGTPNYLLVGENIYFCSVTRPGRDVLLGHQALMESPGHRANILDPRFERVGVGIYRDAGGAIWVTQMFLRSGE
jgi:uncharacterized protein YkwD